MVRRHIFNIGINVGAAAGHTVFYLHVHLIPRYKDDIPDPRGGIRHVIPSKANYLAPNAGAGRVEEAHASVRTETEAPAPAPRLVSGGENDLLPY